MRGSARRGLAPSESVLATLLAPADASSACPPPVLVESTIKAAMGFAANPAATAGLATTQAVALTERILRNMAFSRFKVATHLALAAGIAAAVAWLAKPHVPATNPAAITAQTQVVDAQLPPGKPAATEQSRLQSPEPAATASDTSAKSVAARASAESPIVRQPLAVPAMPDQLFADAPAGSGRTANDWKPAAAKPAVDTAVHEERLTQEERARGEILFNKDWMPDDPRSHGGDGLGPVYNESSCVACHGLGGPGGAGPLSKNVVLITPAPTGCGPIVSPERIHPGLRGSQTAVLHRYGTDPEYASWLKRFYASNRAGQQTANQARREESVDSRIQALKEQTSPDRRIQEISADQRSMNGFNVNISERNTPPLFGVGLIDQIPSEVLVALAARQPAAIRGRVNRTKEGRIGRFGSKAQVPTLHEFVRGACANELGLEVPGHAQGVSPLVKGSMAKGLDLTEPECDDLVAYVRSLPAPTAIDLSGPLGTQDMRTGRRLFAQVNCARAMCRTSAKLLVSTAICSCTRWDRA